MLGETPERVHPALYALLGVVGVLVFFVVAPLWAAVLGGLLVGYLGYPVMERVSEHVDSDGLAAAASLALIALGLLIPLGLAGYLLVREARGVFASLTAERLDLWLEGLAEFTRSWTGWPAVDPEKTAGGAMLAELVPWARGQLLSWLPNAAQFAFEFFLAATIVVFIGYYALKDGPDLVSFVIGLLPLEPSTETRLVGDVGRYLDAVVFGQVATALVQGGLAGLGFWFLGVPSPVFLGFLSAVLSILPGIGPFLVWIPAAVYLFAIGATVRGFLLVLWGGLVVSTSDHVIRSKVISTKGGMHPSLALVGVIGGLIAFGIMGFVVGPVLLALFVTLLGLYIEEREAVLQAREETVPTVRVLEADDDGEATDAADGPT